MKHGQHANNTSATGRITKKRATVSKFTITRTNTKAIGKMIYVTEKEHTGYALAKINTENYTQEIGQKIKNTDKVFISTKTVAVTTEPGKIAKEKERVL